MASGAIGDPNRPTENIKVYSRRIKKKAPKISNNCDSATTATENPAAAAASDNPTTTATPTEVSCATAATTAPAEVSSSTSKEPNDSLAAASPPATGHGITPVAKDADSCRQEQSPSQQKLQEQQQNQQDRISLSEAQEGSGSENTESQNLEDLRPLNGNEANNLKKPSPVQNLNESSILSGETNLPHGGEDEELIPNGNGVVKSLLISRVDDRVRFKLAKSTAKNEVKELSKKLKSELDHVRRLVKHLEAEELHLASSYNNNNNNTQICISTNNLSDRSNFIGGFSHPHPQTQTQTRPISLMRMNSDMGTVRNLEPRPYSRQLSVAVMENNNHMNNGEFVEKEKKRTPKANQYYRNSEFLLGKDRLPPENNNKRIKTNSGRKDLGFGFDSKSRNQAFKSCSSLLQRLMKHKHGWVFNEPVNAKQLGLVDYHDIIKHPMDLGTIKNRLSQNWYKFPKEFAEDVRLVFHNAMTYNPKGQDVHVMAELLLQIFEERWGVIETEYSTYWKYPIYQDSGFPTSRKKAPPPVHVPPVQIPAVYTMTTTPMAVDPKFVRPPPRTPVPKKPKAKDPNKRDMTSDEKQKLSTNLQGLGAEKLEAIVQIIKKRSGPVSQNDDEVEIDIDSIDIETLWELDRLVTNYKKSLSKNKRKAELALQARSVSNQTAPLNTNTNPGVEEARIETGTAFEKSNAPPAVEGEKQEGYNGNRSSSSSSSSSDSGSSSSDSDSDSSSADGSDAGRSPGT